MYDDSDYYNSAAYYRRTHSIILIYINKLTLLQPLILSVFINRDRDSFRTKTLQNVHACLVLLYLIIIYYIFIILYIKPNPLKLKLLYENTPCVICNVYAR